MNILLASVYNGGSYNSSTYNGQNSSNGSPGLLTNTGFDIALIVTIACALSLAALVVRILKRPGRNTSISIK